jgi:ketosteroid isomerase-like protein
MRKVTRRKFGLKEQPIASRKLARWDIKMRMVILVLAAVLAAAPFTAAPAAVSDETDVLATVKQYLDYFNKSNEDKAAGLCAPQTIIIDDFPPHEWQGANACSDWWNAYAAFAKNSGITDDHVALGKPWHITVTGDRAYVVVPATYTYNQKGKPITESDSVWTLALQKLAGGWRIAGWAWAQH